MINKIGIYMKGNFFSLFYLNFKSIQYGDSVILLFGKFQQKRLVPCSKNTSLYYVFLFSI